LINGSDRDGLNQLIEDMSAVLATQWACQRDAQSIWKAIEDKCSHFTPEAISIQVQDDVKEDEPPRRTVSPDREVVIAHAVGSPPATEDHLKASKSGIGLERGKSDSDCSVLSSRTLSDTGSLDRMGRSLERGKSTGSVQDIVEAEIEQEKSSRAVIEKRQPWWIRAVRTSHFDVAVGVLIMLTTVTMAWQLEHEGNVLRDEKLHGCKGSQCTCDTKCQIDMETMFRVVELVFTALFALELTLRLAAEGWQYLKSFGNLMDAAIVFMSVVELILSIAVPNNDSINNVAILRLLRLAKLSKVLRIVRVLKVFEPLRVLVSTIVASVSALVWSMTLLFVLELIGAIFLGQLLHTEFAAEVDSDSFLWDHFGTWSRAMLTMFEITMAPGGFLLYRSTFSRVHPLFGCFITFYVCVVTFAIVRVITAMFLKETINATDHDDLRIKEQIAARRLSYAAHLAQAVDVDGSGGIDEEEFKSLVAIPKIQEWVEDVQLSEQELTRLFHALADAETGEVVFEHFVNALAKMRSPLSPSDQVIMLIESRSSSSRTRRLEDAFMRLHPWLNPPLHESQNILPQNLLEEPPSSAKSPHSTSTWDKGSNLTF
jgi:hypothetical protein